MKELEVFKKRTLFAELIVAGSFNIWNSKVRNSSFKFSIKTSLGGSGLNSKVIELFAVWPEFVEWTIRVIAF